MKKLFLTLTSLITAGTILTACGSDDDTVTVGVNGSGVPVWEYMKEKAAEEDITIDIVEFADYVRPNQALADGEIDINAFQTVSYFDHFKEQHNLDLVPIGATYLAPMGLYSDKHESPEDIPEGATITIDQEETNQGRALLLLEEAGLIGLADDFEGVGGPEYITENPLGLEFEQIQAAHAPRALPDVDAAVINNGVAREAGFSPLEDAIYIEGATADPYINIIAAQAERQDDETLLRVVELYQQEDVENYLLEAYNQALVPMFVSLEELQDY